jgi:tetratricopeptide (TPR) repeat protein
MTAPLRRLLAALSACLLAAACVPPQTGDGVVLPEAGSRPSLDREQAQVHRQLGLGLEAAGEIAAAVDEYEAALSLGPWPLNAATGGLTDSPYGDLARICWRRDPAAQVVRACTRAISSLRFQGGPLAELFANRADAHLRLGEPDRAQADYKTVRRIDSSNPRGLLARGRMRAREGRHTTALIDFNRIIATGPGRAEARFARALSLIALGDFEGAIADYDHILADPEALAAHPDAYRDRAGIHCLLGQADAAAIGWQVWLGATQGGAAYVQEMLWAQGYLRGAVADDFTPAALAALRAWTRAGCPGG